MFSVIKSTKLAVGVLMMSGIEEMLNYYEAFRKVLPSKLLEYKTISKPILAGLNGRSE
jgi:hypothetical protein